MAGQQSEHSGQVLDSVAGYDVIACDCCGFKHILPIPDRQELAKVYQEEYYSTEKPLFIERQIEDIEWWNLVFDDRYDFFEQVLPSTRRSILDIGCGPGFFLKRGQERGWHGVGLEPSRQAAAFAEGQGCVVLNRFMHEADLIREGKSFDVVHMSEVLEHIPDPVSLCETAHALLAEGGVLCVVVPNDYNPFQNLLREQLGFSHYWLAPPHHINYFDYDSMEGLLKKVGFSILDRTAMFPMDLFLLMGDDYVGNDELGRLCHAKRKRLDILLNSAKLRGFKKEMYQLMAKHGIGREIVIYGKK